MTKIAVIIPAYNEQDSIALVVKDIPTRAQPILVVDNNSADATAKVAQSAGAIVLQEKRKGYGYACLKGIQYLNEKHPDTEIVVFLDGDYSDFPEEMDMLLEPILSQEVDFVLGARVARLREKGSMTPQQVFGNGLATFLMRMFFASKFTDLGPFRAIRYNTLQALEMQDKTYGWTVEMQLKILKRKIPYREIPVRYRNRIGVSKVSGTLMGTIGAGYKIMGWILKYAFA